MAKVTIDLYVGSSFDTNIPDFEVWVGQVDVGDNDNLPLKMTFQCSDAHDPTMKKGNHSTNFMLPASPDNLRVFRNLNNVLSGYVDEQSVQYYWSTVVEFTRKYKFDAIISVDSNNVLWGTLQVKAVMSVNGEPQRFEAVFLSGSSDWSTELSKKTLKELFSDDNIHYFSGQRLAEYFNVTTLDADSEQDFFGDGGYWLDSTTYMTSTLTPLWYPLISYGKPQFDYFLTVEDFKPSLFIENMVRRMFTDLGYTVRSKFFEKDFFKRLLYPLHDTRYGTEQLNYNRLDCQRSTTSSNVIPFASSYAALYTNNSQTTTPNSTNAGGRPLRCNNVSLDPSGGYSTVTGQWIVAETGYYNINANVICKMLNVNSHYKGELVVTINLIPTGVYAGTPQANDLGPMQHNNTSYSYNPTDENAASDPRTITCQTCIDACYLIAGDTVVVKAGLLNPGGSYPNIGQAGTIGSGDDELTIVNSHMISYAAGSTFTCELLPILAAHSYYKLVDFIPNKNCMEFFKGLTHLFNLQVLTDSKTKSIYIEPFDSFYGHDVLGNKTDALIWDTKQDMSAEVKDTFLETLKQTIVFDYKEDGKDFNLSAYREGNVQGVGDGEVNVGLGGYAETIGAGFPQGATVYSNPHFAATFEFQDTGFSGMVSSAQNAGAVTGSGNLNKAPRIPCIWADQGDLSKTYEPERPPKSNTFEPRILYMQGYRSFKSPETVAGASTGITPYESVMCFDYFGQTSYQVNLDQEMLPRACFSNVNIPFQADFQSSMTITSTTGEVLNGTLFSDGILVGYTNVNGVQKALVMMEENLSSSSGQEMFTWFEAGAAAQYWNGSELDSPTSIFALAGTTPDYGWTLPSAYDGLAICNFYYSDEHQNLEPNQQLTMPSGYWITQPINSGEDLTNAGGCWFSCGYYPVDPNTSIQVWQQGTANGALVTQQRVRYVKYVDLDSTEWTNFSAQYNISGGELVPYTALYDETFIYNDLVNLNFNDVEAYNPLSTTQGSGTTNGTQTFTNKGLYNLFWRNMIDDYKTRPRLRTVKIFLDQKDITTLDLRRLIYLDGAYWRINKINGYAPNLDVATEVELIQHMQKHSIFKGTNP